MTVWVNAMIASAGGEVIENPDAKGPDIRLGLDTDAGAAAAKVMEDIAAAGVGGPGSQEGRPPGTVHLAIADGRGTRSHEVHLEGDPDEVLASATTLALVELAKALGATPDD